MKCQLKVSALVPILAVSLVLPLAAQATTPTKTTLDGVRVNPGAVAKIQEIKILAAVRPGDPATELKAKSFLIESDQSLAMLLDEVNTLMGVRAAQDAAEKAAKKSEKIDFKFRISRNPAKGLDEILRLGKFIQNRRVQNGGADDADTKMALVHMKELAEAFSANFMAPIPEKLALPQVVQNLFADVGDTAGGTAWNIDKNKSRDGDLSKVNPPDSTFWRQPGEISQKETYFGFGRASLPIFPTDANLAEACEYKGPKEGYGTHGGIEVECAGKEWKVKFGNETQTEQFTGRIVDALGYNATPVEFASDFVVKYDRGIIRDFNSRKEMTTMISFAGLIHWFKKESQSYRDPFHEMVKAAIMKDGRRLTSSELRAELLKDQAPEAEKSNSAYKAVDSEQDGVAYLILNDASVEPKIPKNASNVGAWSWDSEEHKNRRELRGFALFAAWINNYDMRWDNTRLRIVEHEDGSREMRHVISDLGSGLGKAIGQYKHSSGVPNDLPWDMMREDSTRGFVIPWFVSLLPNQSFRTTNIDDARWMARLIGQLTEEQIKSALISTGRPSAEVKLYLEKLIARRDQMIKVLKLSSEIPLLRPAGSNDRFSYDPSVEGPVSITVNGKTIAAPIGASKVVNGELI